MNKITAYRVVPNRSLPQMGVVSFFLTSVVVGQALSEETVRFNRDIRPILSQNCFRCHGPDADQRKSDLRLDQEDGIRQKFTPRQLTESEAWRRINSDDPEEHMPPPESRLELKPEQIATIRRWIEQGAAWEGTSLRRAASGTNQDKDRRVLQPWRVAKRAPAGRS